MVECKELTLRYLEANGYYPITEDLLVNIPKERQQLYMEYDYVKFRDGQPYFYSTKYLESNSFKEIEYIIKKQNKYIADIEKREKIKQAILVIIAPITVSIIVSIIFTLILNRINF